MTITYKEFIKQVEENKFKVEEVSYSKLIDKKNHAQMMYGNIKKDADNYNVNSVRYLFNEMCDEHGEIIDINTYLAEYKERVKQAIEADNRLSTLCHEEKKVYRDIMELRGYSAYKSNLAELSLSLHCEEYLSDTYEVVADQKCDGILGVDVVLLHKEEDIAHYIHITKNTKFSMNKLKRKSGKEVTVIDNRIKVLFNTEDEQQRQHVRRFKNHVLALYQDGEYQGNKIINGVYIFKSAYIEGLIEDNFGLCDKRQYEELEHLEYSKKQTRNYGGRTITFYE